MTRKRSPRPRSSAGISKFFRVSARVVLTEELTWSSRLERDGSLDYTIIVLMADHRMRFMTVQNGAGVALLPHGKVKDVTMRIPMLV
jgi:hypothetical protein